MPRPSAAEKATGQALAFVSVDDVTRAIEEASRLPVLMLKIEDLALICRCSKSEAANLIYKPKGNPTIPSVRVGGLRRIRLDDLRAVLAGLTPDLGPEASSHADEDSGLRLVPQQVH